MTKAELYEQYLADEGYRPKRDDDGDIVFKHEGGTFIIFANEDDQAYFRMVYPSFWPIESDEERERARYCVDRTNFQIKVAKLYFTSDLTNIWAGIELLYADPEQFKELFPRCLRILRAAINDFKERMLEGQQN